MNANKKRSLLPGFLNLVLIFYVGNGIAATAEEKSAYKADKDTASATYKVERAKCDNLTDNPKDVCIAQAKAMRVQSDATATANYKNTLSARTSARKTIADANYDLAKAKCDSLVGNSKDVCIKEAKASKVTAVAEAVEVKKVQDARVDANADIRKADYKVALEKCDASTGAAKDACVAAAKSHYGQ